MRGDKMDKILLYVFSPLLFLRLYLRDWRRLFGMCRIALDRSKPTETADLVLILAFMIPVLLASPVVLLYTAYKKTKRVISYYGRTDPDGDVS